MNDNEEKILLTICARGGSKGVKNKNIRELCGKPLIAHTILQAKKWGRASHIICSTDSPEIAKIAKEYGAEVPFMRPDSLATDTAAKMDVIKHAVETIEEQNHEEYGTIIDLDATSPIRTVEDIEEAYKYFVKMRPKSLLA